MPAFAEAARTIGSPQIRNAGTVGGNISLGDPQVGPEQVRRAARAVRADRFIEKMPGGYDAEIREALKDSVSIIVDTVRGALDETPPELIADLILERGFQAPVLCGHACALMNAAGSDLDTGRLRVGAAAVSGYQHRPTAGRYDNPRNLYRRR